MIEAAKSDMTKLAYGSGDVNINFGWISSVSIREACRLQNLTILEQPVLGPTNEEERWPLPPAYNEHTLLGTVKSSVIQTQVIKRIISVLLIT